MAKKIKLIPLKPRIDFLSRSYQNLQKFIENRLFGFTIYTDKKARKLKREILDRLERQGDINAAWIAANIPKAYKEASTIARDKLERIGESPKKSIVGLEKRTIKAGMVTVSTRLDFINQQIEARVNTFFREYKKAWKKLNFKEIQNLADWWSEDISREIDDVRKDSLVPREYTTLAGAEYFAVPPVREVQKNVKASFEKVFGDFDFIRVPLKNGKFRNYRPDTYFGLVTRTEMRNIQTAAVKNRCAEYNNDLVWIPSHMNPCRLCAPFEGQIFSISGKDEFYPPLDEAPPLHPHCEHHIEPMNRSNIRFMNTRAEGKGLPSPFAEPRFDLKVESIRESLKKAA